MVKLKLNVGYDNIIGRVSGGYTGILELTDEEFKDFKRDPRNFLDETGAHIGLKFYFKSMDIQDFGEFTVDWEEVNE